MVDELESHGWYERIREASGESTGPTVPEALLPISWIRSVTCLDDSIADVPLDDGSELSDIVVNGGTTIHNNIADLVARQETEPEKSEVDDEATNEEDLLSEDTLLYPQDLIAEPITLIIGWGLIRLADPARRNTLLPALNLARTSLGAELGIIVPKVRVRDEMRLDEGAYQIVIRDQTVGEGRLIADKCLAIPSDSVVAELDGVVAVESTYGLEATWIEPERREKAEILGYCVVDPTMVLATHYQATLKRHAGRLFSFDMLDKLLDQWRETDPSSVQQLVPDVVSLPILHEVLRRFLEEGFSIRTGPQIVEAIARHVGLGNIDSIYSRVRQEFRHFIPQRFADEQGVLPVVGCDRPFARFLDQLGQNGAPAEHEEFPAVVEFIGSRFKVLDLPIAPVMVVPSAARWPLWESLRHSVEDLHLVTSEEIAGVKCHYHDTLKLSELCP